METGGIPPAGSGRALRLDPFALPVRYPAKDSGADGQVRQVELHRERVVLRRAVRGMRMKLGLPVSAFRGVALRLAPADGDQPAAVTLTLDHNDDALCVPLYAASDSDNIAAIWKAWGRVLRSAAAGRRKRRRCARGCCAALAPSRMTIRSRAAAAARRIKRRRPSILLRRKPGRRIDGAPVHRGEHEIIARN